MRPWPIVLLALAALTVAVTVSAQAADRTAEVAELQDLVAEIRGRPFTRPIAAVNQSDRDFEAYLDRQLASQLAPGLAEHFETVVRAVGLYRGEELGDILDLSKQVMMTQAAAYYDPDTSTFYIVLDELPDAMRRPLFAHELTHGLQDQYHDLDAYLLDQGGGRLDDDALLARQAVVEGEATYVMTVASVKDVLGVVPAREMLGMAISVQAGMSTEQLAAMAATGADGELAEAAAAMENIPAFLMETLLGSYMKGQAFVFEIQADGWSAVDRLFTHPPLSTEQILHPEKYTAGETPVRFDLETLPAELTRGWTRLHANVLGEMQWRIVLREHGLGDIAGLASAGWDGDAYAVYTDDAGATLLLLATHWDTQQDAEDFAAAYQGVIDAKGGHGATTRLLRHDGRFVGIVEGGSPETALTRLDALKTLHRERLE